MGSRAGSSLHLSFSKGTALSDFFPGIDDLLVLVIYQSLSVDLTAYRKKEWTTNNILGKGARSFNLDDDLRRFFRTAFRHDDS